MFDLKSYTYSLSKNIVEIRICHLIRIHTTFHTMNRAYPGSEFVVANSLAKWKKLEPNEINLAKVLTKKEYQEVFLYLTLS